MMAGSAGPAAKEIGGKMKRKKKRTVEIRIVGMLSGFERLDIAKPNDTKGQIKEPVTIPLPLPPTVPSEMGRGG